MRIDIGNNLHYVSNFSSNTLPTASASYESIYSATGRGQLVEASFKFDSEKISFRMILNGESEIDVDVDNLKDFHNMNKYDHNMSSIYYVKDSKLLVVKFPVPVQYTEGIEFLAKTNDGNKTKKLKGYTVLLNKEVE